MRITLTPEYRKRTLDALTETVEKREKEMRYSPDLRKHDMIAFYDEHITRLQAALEVGYVETA